MWAWPFLLRGENNNVKTYKIALCRFPGSTMEHNHCTSWLMRTLHEMKSDPRIDGILEVVECDTPITMTRNRAVRKAQVAGCDYILMVDSDMGPDYLLSQDPLAVPFWKTAWEFMVTRREEEDRYLDELNNEFEPETYEAKAFAKFPPATIAAPYCGPPPDETCYIFQWHSFETSMPEPPTFRLQMINREDAAIRSGIEEAAALPTGLILYDIRVFDLLEKNDGLPWFDYEYEDKYQMAKASTEDVFQTRNASLLGCPQYVLWDAWAKHHKHKGVEKPHVITRESVHKSLRNAVIKDVKQGERLRFQSRVMLPEEARQLRKAPRPPSNAELIGEILELGRPYPE